MTADGFHWTTEFSVTKYATEEDFESDRPYTIDTYEGNLGLTEGFNEMWQLITAAGGTSFNNTTVLRVGSGTTAETAADTGLATSLGTATVSGAPTFGTGSATWTASFGAGTATGAWNEWTIENTAGKNLNRKVQSMGTKGAAEVWTLTTTLTLN